MKNTKKNILRTVAIGAAAVLALTGCSAAADSVGGDGEVSGDGQQQAITLKLATTQVEDAPENAALWVFVDKMAEKAPWVEFDYIGGPETIAPTDMAESVQLGAVDIASVCSCYYTQLIPEAAAFDVAPTSPSDDRDNGALDMQQQWHAESGVHLLGGSVHEMAFITHYGPRYTELDLEDLDLSGWLMRSAQTAQPAVEALGAEVVNLPISEVYTAMERNTIDGFAAGNTGMYALGIAEPIQASLLVDLLYVRYPILFNQSSWDRLSDETKTALTEAMAETEDELTEIFLPLIEDEQEQWIADGKVMLEPSDEAAERIAAQAQNELWDRAIELSPRVQEIRDLYDAL